MNRLGFTESTVEKAALSWFQELGYSILHGPDISPGELLSERASYADILLISRLSSSLAKINPTLSAEVIDEAIRKLTRIEHPHFSTNNHRFHQFLFEGIPVEHQKDGRTVTDYVSLVDPIKLENNDWLVVNQFTVIENKNHRRPDMVVFINGLPLGVIELKNPADENATIRDAFKQIETYKAEISSLFIYNEVNVISDGTEAKAGTISSNLERFMPWKTLDGINPAPAGLPQLEVLIKGMFNKERFLDLIRHFIVFELHEKGNIKKMAGYHQYHAVQKAIESTVEAIKGDKRAGIVWHTQGSGKSLTMMFYSGKLVLHPAMANPTLLVLTDRNDLDDQLFGTFSACHELLRQTPVQAESRSHLRELLKVASGGVVFTTIQKFMPPEAAPSPSGRGRSEAEGEGEGRMPLLSDRRNIVVIADEAHRSQYDFMDGFARHLRDALPNASFIGFTATPIEKSDRSTPAVFGNYVDVYDIHQAILDGATLPIYYEARLAKLDLKEEEKPKIDPEFEEVTEGEEESVKKKLKSRWARIEALVGAEKRIHLLAKDIVDHFEKRLEAIDGKGMIVGMSRRICVDLYNAIVALRPNWESADDDKGFLKVVMTGSATDPVNWQQHIRNKERREKLGDNFKDDKKPFKLVIVRDMWLTGFDVPSLHTMYIDKPMKDHSLMQAIARVNRVFKDKEGGLIVDYLGIAHELKKALSEYSERDRDQAGIPQEVAVGILLEKFEIMRGIFHGFDYKPFFRGTAAERVRVIPAALDFLLSLKDGKSRFMKVVTDLSRAFALAVPNEKALAIRDEIGFFHAIRAALVKNTGGPGQHPEDLDTAIQQIVSKAVSSEQVIDIFSAAGLKKPDLSILSEEFLAEVRDYPHKNLALELLRKLINDEIKLTSKRNLVQSRSFAEMLEKTILQYHNRAIEAAEVIEELIRLAREMKDAHKRGENLGLSEDELAFYDALETNDSAVKVLGDETLREIAHELVRTIRQNVSIDWTVKENVRAKMRTLVKRILRKHGYPPDKQEKATQTVMEQAELLCKDWAG
jgi:type I restriction enzyme R subunit